MGKVTAKLLTDPNHPVFTERSVTLPLDSQRLMATLKTAKRREESAALAGVPNACAIPPPLPQGQYKDRYAELVRTGKVSLQSIYSQEEIDTINEWMALSEPRLPSVRLQRGRSNKVAQLLLHRYSKYLPFQNTPDLNGRMEWVEERQSATSGLNNQIVSPMYLMTIKWREPGLGVYSMEAYYLTALQGYGVSIVTVSRDLADGEGRRDYAIGYVAHDNLCLDLILDSRDLIAAWWREQKDFYAAEAWIEILGEGCINEFMATKARDSVWSPSNSKRTL